MRYIDLCHYFNYLAERVVESKKKYMKGEIAYFLTRYKRGKYSSSDAIVYIDAVRKVIDEKYAKEVDEKIYDMKCNLELEMLIDHTINDL